MTTEDILKKYPVLQNPQMNFAIEQIKQAMNESRVEGKKEMLRELNELPVEVSTFKEKGKPAEKYLKTSFVERLISEVK